MMMAPTDLQNFSASISILYQWQSIVDFPAHALATTIKTIDLDGLQYRGRSRRSSQPTIAEVQEVERIFKKSIERHSYSSNYGAILTGSAAKLETIAIESAQSSIVGIYWQFFDREKFDRNLYDVFVDEANPLVIHAIYLFQSSGISISIERERLVDLERDRQILNSIHPHLVSAHANAITYSDCQRQIRQRDRVLSQMGIAILSDRGKVKLLTERAAKLLNHYCELELATLDPTSEGQLPPRILAWLGASGEVDRSEEEGERDSTLTIDRDGKRMEIFHLFDPETAEYLLWFEESKAPTLSIESLQQLGLSQRETEVLFWLAHNKKNEEIALELNCKPNTVKKHIENLYLKLDVKSRTEAVLLALTKIGAIVAPPLSCQIENIEVG
jgi:DNA-binding CsgD family transcriptional regulator